jgi:Tol biopolymer transport system component
LQQDAGGIAWSRDDRTLALADSYTPHPMPAGFVMDAIIVAVDVGSGAVRTLTPHDRRFMDEHPSWAPDGTIYFQSNREGAAEIFRMNADGSNQRRVTSKQSP